MLKQKDFKTTIAGIMKIAAVALGFIGVGLSPENQETVVSAAVIGYTAISAAQAYFTADKTK